MQYKTIRYLTLIVILGFLYGCAPGHQLAFKQLESRYSGPILSIQGYVIKGQDKKDSLKQSWRAIAQAMQQQPGFISSHLSPGIGESTLWLVHSEWSSLGTLRNAFAVAEVQRLEEAMPEQQFEHLFAYDGTGQLSVHK